LTHGARHEWTVGARFGDGRYARSPAFTFVTARGGPAQVQLDQPADGATVGPSLALSWQAVDGVESSYFRYDVELSTEPDFSTLVRNERITEESTSLVVDGLDSGTYYWRVRAGNAAEQNWSDARRFTIPTPTHTYLAEPPVSFDVSLYPSPSSTFAQLEVDLDAPATIDVQVYGADGRRVESASIPVTSAGRHVRRLNTSVWPAGVYFARVTAGDQVRTSRFVVLH
ncbi:MAG: T9SS type A sorting domain-containing protein, partial [Bacteroidota bacterium]